MLPSQYLILKLSCICIWKVSSLFNKGISSFYCIYMYFMYLFQNNFNSSTPTCFIYIRENDIFPYWAHLDVPQTLLELSNSQGKQWAEVWSHITNGQLMALLGQKYFLPQKLSTCLAEIRMDFFTGTAKAGSKACKYSQKHSMWLLKHSHKI